jgi:isorenieratene synthase
VDEYLLFDLVVIAGPAAASGFEPTSFRGRWKPAIAAALLVALPFVAWDLAVTGRHWWFDTAHTRIWLLWMPLGEWLFFLTVPIACAYTWEMLTGGHDPEPVRRAGPAWSIATLLALAAAAAWARGLEYTAVASGALAFATALDLTTGGRVTRHRRFLHFVLLVVAFTAVFNGYLTARPLVLYDSRYQLDVRLGTIPVEDFAYGLALVLANVVVFERLRDRLDAPRAVRGDTVARRLIRERLGGYRRQVNVVREDAAPRLERGRRVAVVGAGLAGLRAATLLADRGFAVSLFEKTDHIGGKIGAWPHELPDGTTVEVAHGFHAFFRQYYNLRRFLDEVGAAPMRAIADYRILGREGRAYGFRDLDTTPILNVAALVRTPMMPMRELLRRPRLARLTTMMAYHPDDTFARWDDESFAAFADRVDLTPELRIVFNSFARAFFATPDRMSAAEVIKSFHFYYFSHDLGLLYDHPCDAYGPALLAPIRARLEALGVALNLGIHVDAIGAGADGFRIGGETFDYMVLAPDVVGARAIAESSPDLHRLAPVAMAKLSALEPGQRNAVLRLWLDRPSGADLPGFVVVDNDRLLDSITFFHRVEAAAGEWAARTGGSVVELHCYAMPDAVDEADVAGTLEAEMRAVLPELRNCRVLASHLQVNRNFTAFHVGMHARRPGVTTDDPRLVLAGDWVALRVPAMLMEAAVTSGVEAANAIASREGVREEPVFSVPLHGLLARPPARPR